MNRDEADRAITGLSAAYDRVATAMYAIDSHPGLAFLRSGGLAGRTREVWGALSPEIDARWAEFTAFGAVLESAREIRAQYRPSDPQWSDLQRKLTAEAPRLAATLDAGCTSIGTILGDVNASWSISTTGMASVVDAMATLSRQATDVGDSDGIAPLDRRVTLAAESVLADPLTVAPGGTLARSTRAEFDKLASDIAAASARLAEQVRARDSFPEQITALSAQIDIVAATEDGVRVAYARANEKIVNPGLPDEPRASDILRARLSELDNRRTKRDWRRLADDLAMTEASIARALARADELAAAANGLVARRDELRGRLEAYRAKATSHRLDEHDTLMPLLTYARSLLFTAPCDLHAATRSVYAYQKALTELVHAQEDVTT